MGSCLQLDRAGLDHSAWAGGKQLCAIWICLSMAAANAKYSTTMPVWPQFPRPGWFRRNFKLGDFAGTAADCGCRDLPANKDVLQNAAAYFTAKLDYNSSP